MDDEVEERPTSSEDYGDAEIIAAGGIVEDDWRLPKYNPLGRLAFGPPPRHRLEVLPFLQSVALRYKKDLKRLFKSYTNIYGHRKKHLTGSKPLLTTKKGADTMPIEGLMNLLKDFQFDCQAKLQDTRILLPNSNKMDTTGLFAGNLQTWRPTCVQGRSPHHSETLAASKRTQRPTGRSTSLGGYGLGGICQVARLRSEATPSRGQQMLLKHLKRPRLRLQIVLVWDDRRWSVLLEPTPPFG